MPTFNQYVSKIFKTGEQNAARVMITTTVFFGVFVLFHFNLLQRFELVTYDYRVMARGSRPADPRIVVIEMSDDSVAKIGRWPWDRDWHATMIKILKEMGAKDVVFDVIFSEKSNPEKDEIFAQAIKDAKNVYLAEIVDQDASRTKLSILTSLPEFTHWAAGGGHINLHPDIDGVMRRIPLVIQAGNREIPQMSFSVALDELKLDIMEVQKMEGGLFIFPRNQKPFVIPLDHDGNLIINWLGRWKEAYQHYSYIDVITSYVMMQKGQAPLIDLHQLNGKICYIGTSATGLFDIRPTPLEPSYPAVGVNLTVLNNVLERKFIKEFTYKENLTVLLCLALLLFWIMKLSSYFKTAVFTAAVALAYVGFTTALFVYFSVWANMIYPLTLVLATYFFVTLHNQLSVTLERAKLLKLATRDSLTGLFNIGHFKLLLKAELTTLAMRPNRNLSILMSDVDHFKNTNDTYGHQMGDAVLKEVAAIIKSTCRALDVAARYGGEEFIVMLPGANDQEAFKVAEKIRKSISQKVFFHAKGDFSATISLGVTQVSPEEKDMAKIVERADKALYEAKHTGRDRAVIAADSPGANLRS